MKPEEFAELIVKAMEKALQPLIVQFNEIKSAQAKEAQESGEKIVGEVAKVITAQAAIEKRLGELEGETPRAFRASRDASTVIDAEKAKTMTPRPDEKASVLASFIDNLIAGKQQ
jgi:hypothetical protein